MRIRLVLGTALVILLVGLLLADHYLFPASRPLGSALIVILGAAGWLEFASLVGMAPGGARQDWGFLLLGLAGTLAFHAISWQAGGQPAAAARLPIEEGAVLALGLLVLAAFGLAVFRRDFSRHYRSVLETIAGSILLGLLLSYLLRIYRDPDRGLVLSLVFLAGIKGTDIAAFLVGSTWGRVHFLAVSPRKTLEGSLAAVAWGGLWFGGAAWFLEGVLFPWPAWIGFGIILSAAAQVGDLSESLFKREYQAKDSRRLLPEFGGVLDLIDSLVYSGFLFWWLLELLGK